jgi:hypothetical protein
MQSLCLEAGSRGNRGNSLQNLLAHVKALIRLRKRPLALTKVENVMTSKHSSLGSPLRKLYTDHTRWIKLAQSSPEINTLTDSGVHILDCRSALSSTTWKTNSVLYSLSSNDSPYHYLLKCTGISYSVASSSFQEPIGSTTSSVRPFGSEAKAT